MTRRFTNVDELTAAVGEHLGYTDWLLIDQQRIDTFAAATGGSTIAHGYLTLSLVPALVSSLVEYAGWGVRINYGSNKVRFPAPVAVGSRVRAGLEIAAVETVRAGIQVCARVTVESETPEGLPGAKPALVAELLTLLADPSASP